jgi:hypothetical protein
VRCQPSSIPFAEGKTWGRLGHCDARHASLSVDTAGGGAERERNFRTAAAPPPLPPLSCAVPSSWEDLQRRSERRGRARRRLECAARHGGLFNGGRAREAGRPAYGDGVSQRPAPTSPRGAARLLQDQVTAPSIGGRSSDAIEGRRRPAS